MKQTYWYDSTSSQSHIRTLEMQYNETIKRVHLLGNKIKENVCVDGAWFDDNAITFARWWNDQTHFDQEGQGGNLKWNENKKELVIDSTDTKADGQDRLKHIVNMEGKTFYIAVCKSLQALESSHENVKWQMKKYIKKAKDPSYNLSVKTMGKKWIQFMSDVGCEDFVWTPLNIPQSSKGKTTDLNKVESFSKEVATCLFNLEQSVDAYYKSINSLINNTYAGKWWGFSEEIKYKITKITKEFTQRSNTKMKNFKKNLNLALTKTIDAKKGDLKILKELKNVKFD